MATGFSFSFSKKKPSTTLVTTSKIAERVEDDDGVRCDIVTAIDDKQIESATPILPKQELVIPCIKDNNWRINSLKKRAKRNGIANEEKGPDDADDQPATTGSAVDAVTNAQAETLEERAKRELLSEVARDNEDWENRGHKDSSLVIPVFIRNAVPEGLETDEQLDVSARADNPTIEDYERVPVEHFGLAMLRGMGWKEGDAVGGKMKALVAPIEAAIRPKGLGLGAEAPKPKKPKVVVQNGKEIVEDLELKRGCHVCCEIGELKGFYGTVEGIDDDLVRASVRLVLNGLSVMVPIAGLRVVSKSEFAKEGKILNKSSYEEYKKSKEKDEQQRSNPKQEPRQESDRQQSSWLYRHLRVRIIDKKYHSGKYYKEKVVIRECDGRRCTCRTSDKITLENLHQDQLETVIPRDEGAKVLIVGGEHKGRMGTLVKRDSDKSLATVKLKSESSSKEIVQIDYDHVCEFAD